MLRKLVKTDRILKQLEPSELRVVCEFPPMGHALAIHEFYDERGGPLEHCACLGWENAKSEFITLATVQETLDALLDLLVDILCLDTDLQLHEKMEEMIGSFELLLASDGNIDDAVAKRYLARLAIENGHPSEDYD